MGIRNGKMGCLLWIVLFALVSLWGFKLLDFYILKPAAIKKGLNETIDQVSIMNNTSAKQVEFLARWADWERTSGTAFTSTAFQGDSFVVQWVDTLHVPVFPSIGHSFSIKRVVR